MPDHLTSPFANAIAVTLIHFLWQGSLIALAYWLLRESLGLRSVRAKYATSLLTLCVMSACPVLTFAWVYDSSHGGIQSSLATETPSVVKQNSIPRYQQKSGNRNLADSAEEASPHNATSIHNYHERSTSSYTGSTPAESSRPTVAHVFQRARPYVLILWLAGVMLSGARLAAGVLNVFWLRAGRQPVSTELTDRSLKLARRLGLGAARIFTSERVREAAVVGFWKPVVLMPASWLTSLPPDVIEAVIAHELAHIRRFDVWANLLQRLMETLLFYHPAVWWLSNTIRLEREMCCDELAIAATGQRGNYAIALEQVGRLQIFGTPRLATSFSGEKKMNLLSRIQNVLGVSATPSRDPAWVLGLAAVVLPLFVAGAGGFLTDQNAAIAQEREGRRSAESETEPRRSPEADSPRRSAEAEAGPRRSPEAEAGPGRSAEAEAGPRRSAEGERGTRRPAESDRERPRGEERERGEERGRDTEESADALAEFKPQTEREEALFRMIQQLRREIAGLRRGADARSRERDGDREEDSFARRDSERPYSDRRRDGDFDETSAPAGWERSKEGKVFLAYDKNGDRVVTVDEWLAMTNGNVSPERREIQTRRFKEADPNRDGKFTPAEFIRWFARGRFEAVERDARDGDGEESRRGPRDGDREESERGRRDGDAESKRGERDGDATNRRGPRDGDRDPGERRDGDGERERSPEDKDSEE